MNDYLARYLVAVEHPGVSAFEHIDMFMLRDRLAEHKQSLTSDDKRRLQAADQRLLQQAAAFQSELAEQESSMSLRDKRRLKGADQRLLEQATAFQSELARVTSLEVERQRRQPPPQHWWWYLDVLTALPRPAEVLPELVPA